MAEGRDGINIQNNVNDVSNNEMGVSNKLFKLTKLSSNDQKSLPNLEPHKLLIDGEVQKYLKKKNTS